MFLLRLNISICENFHVFSNIKAIADLLFCWNIYYKLLLMPLRPIFFCQNFIPNDGPLLRRGEGGVDKERVLVEAVSVPQHHSEPGRLTRHLLPGDNL